VSNNAGVDPFAHEYSRRRRAFLRNRGRIARDRDVRESALFQGFFLTKRQAARSPPAPTRNRDRRDDGPRRDRSFGVSLARIPPPTDRTLAPRGRARARAATRAAGGTPAPPLCLRAGRPHHPASAGGIARPTLRPQAGSPDLPDFSAAPMMNAWLNGPMENSDDANLLYCPL